MPASRRDLAAGGSGGRPPRAHHLLLTILLAVLHSGLLVLASPMAGVWVLTFVSVTPLAWLALRAASTRRAVLVVGWRERPDDPARPR